MTPEKEVSQKDYTHVHPVVDFVERRSDLISKPTLIRKHISQGSNQKEEGGPVAGPGTRSPNVAFGGALSTTHRRMKSYFTSGWNGKQPRTAHSGLRAIPASAACEISAESCACTNVNPFVLSSAPALSSPACWLLGWGSL